MQSLAFASYQWSPLSLLTCKVASNTDSKCAEAVHHCAAENNEANNWPDQSHGPLFLNRKIVGWAWLSERCARLELRTRFDSEEERPNPHGPKVSNKKRLGFRLHKR